MQRALEMYIDNIRSLSHAKKSALNFMIYVEEIKKPSTVSAIPQKARRIVKIHRMLNFLNYTLNGKESQMQKIRAFTVQLITGLCCTSLGVQLFHTAKNAAYSPSSTTLFFVFGVFFSLFGALVALDSINQFEIE